eukprot:1377535-Amorphochlora_amoeboformis.AAC.1
MKHMCSMPRAYRLVRVKFTLTTSAISVWGISAGRSRKKRVRIEKRGFEARDGLDKGRGEGDPRN